jgi:signal transduction histidine kinase
MAKEYFKISSGLKDLIGGQLITDKFAAIFELVKNSFDAYATEVKIIFDKIYTDEGKIIIIDNGKGMDSEDIQNKWLFVAFSAKKDGTEDKKKDYRYNLKYKRTYAGAKGVGRFSCDRLGRTLNLYSIKKNAKSNIEHLKVDWREFEKNQKIEFGKISIESTKPLKIEYSIKNGTILEISNITREDWDREELLNLKDKLSKLIKPKLSNNTKEDRFFRISLEVPEELENDIISKEKYFKEGKGKLYKETVNGEIKNFVFDELDIRTTKIETEIINDGKEIKTRLIDRNIEIYSITERNNYKYLSNSSIHLYFLNQNSKSTFSKRMGEQPINYGNVFVYKNGFRIYPFGEPSNDSLGIDARGTQGYARNLSTRNLIGQIDILQENDQLIESTSRDGGFIKNFAFSELKDFFFDKALKRLEKYVVEVAEWGVDDEKLQELSKEEIKKNLVKLIANISSDDSIISLSYNSKIINLVDAHEQKSANRIIKNFKRIAAESHNSKLLSAAKTLERKFLAYKKLDKENIQLQVEKNLIKSELEIERDKNTYLSVRKPLSEDAEKLIHTINFNLIEIDEMVIGLINKTKSKKNSIDLFTKELAELKFFTEKSRILSEIATRANYKYEAEQQWIDIPTYLKEYLSIYNDIKKNAEKSSKKVEVTVITNNTKFKKYISPIEIAILCDNLISNSIKWKEDETKTTIQVDIKITSANKLEILFSDNGKGLISKYLKFPEKIFELGVTETHGAGIGLNSVKRTLEELGGSIEFAGNNITKLKGACFKILINK